VSAGNVGSIERLEYSVVGETVNVASRLESLTKEFKAPIAISEKTRELVASRYETQFLGESPVRGYSESARVYTVARPSPTEAKA
jgi:adenylate cyclase